jgi:hypothetical protein
MNLAKAAADEREQQVQGNDQARANDDEESPEDSDSEAAADEREQQVQGNEDEGASQIKAKGKGMKKKYNS